MMARISRMLHSSSKVAFLTASVRLTRSVLKRRRCVSIVATWEAFNPHQSSVLSWLTLRLGCTPKRHLSDFFSWQALSSAHGATERMLRRSDLFE